MNEKIERKRETILENLVRHIFRYGFSSLTMEGAAACAKVSKRTLYKHYPNKEALLDAVLNFQVDRFSSLFSAIADDPELDNVAKLNAVLATIAEIARRLPPVLMRDMMNDDRRYWEKIQKARQERIFSTIESIIVSSREEGLIRSDIPTPILTTLLFTILDALANPMTLSRMPFGTREVVDGLTRMLFQGILSDSGRERLNGAQPATGIKALEAILP